MRYYDLKISQPKSGKVWSVGTDGSFTLGAAATSFTSLLSTGKTNPGALNIEIDLTVIPFDTPQGKGSVRVWGVPLKALGQAANLNGADFEFRVGMAAGLPLAKPSQAGLIARGQVFQAFGNWQGKNQTLDLVLYPSAAADDLDISFRWPAGTPLSTALRATFTQAFPGFTSQVAISSQLTLPNDEAHHCTNLVQLANYIRGITLSIGQKALGSSYQGVAITVQGTTIIASDGFGTTRTPTVQLAFEDLIGQPTWIDPVTINFKCVMRKDIAVGSQVQFPSGVVAPYALTGAAAAYPNVPARAKSVFQGTFSVVEVHHFGNFRQADADSWVTAYNAVSLPAQTPQFISDLGLSAGGVA